MSLVFAVLAASVSTFAATNLDDLFLLTVFFGRRVPSRRIVGRSISGFWSDRASQCRGDVGRGIDKSHGVFKRACGMARGSMDPSNSSTR
jgi:hypothetical protein